MAPAATADEPQDGPLDQWPHCLVLFWELNPFGVSPHPECLFPLPVVGDVWEQVP